MRFVSFFRDIFRRPDGPHQAPRTLRNRLGGLAFVKRYGAWYGADAIAGQVVKTVRTTDGGFWVVEPKPIYRVTKDVAFLNGTRLSKGAIAVVHELRDDVLEPLPDTGVTREEVDRLYSPGPAMIPLRVRGEVQAK